MTYQEPPAQELVDAFAPSEQPNARDYFYDFVVERLGPTAEAQEGEEFEHWTARLQNEGLLHVLENPRNLVDIRAAKAAKAEGALIVAEPSSSEDTLTRERFGKNVAARDDVAEYMRQRRNGLRSIENGPGELLKLNLVPNAEEQ